MKKPHLPVFIICISIIAALFFHSTSSVRAQSGTLYDLSDTVNTRELSQTAHHSIRFVLPENAQPLRTNDWIIISMPGFTFITANISIDGTYSGIPQTTVVDNQVKITNIAVHPGYAITINGITASNPGFENALQVTVLISEDEAGAIIKNISSVYPSTGPGNVNVSASVDNPNGRLSISGIAAPTMFVTYTEQGSVMGTDVAGETGFFNHIFPAVMAGDHTFTLFGIDRQRRTTTPIILDIYTPAYQATSVTNQILSPTISIDKSAYAPDEFITAQGVAVPSSLITLFTESPLRTYSASTSAIGEWSYTITDIPEYYAGDYQIHALVQTTEGLTSLTSPSLSFSITSSVPSGEKCGDISHGDFNCDGTTDLTDFSILMYYWGTNSAVCDINNDFLVDLTDFSIMLYYWGS